MGGPVPDRRRSVRWWMPLLGLLGLAVLAAAVIGVLYVTREQPGPKSVEEAVREFDEVAGPSTSAAGSVVLPPAGVYALEGEGRESISFPPVEQADGVTMPASIRHGADDCFVFRIDYNEAHWHEWQLCPDGDVLWETGGRTFQRWDFGVTAVDNLATFVCDPPVPFAARSAAALSGRRDRSCTASNEQVEEPTLQQGAVTFVGAEAVDVGGETVDAVHVRHTVSFSGGQTGESHTELWFSTSDWMPLRGERDVRVDSDSPVGAVTYTETGRWRLRSTDPER